jgi:Polyketide cyclase / dehydrase and lipid transport
MAITTSVIIEASPDEVWRCLEDLSSHVEWMLDAVAIRFVTVARQGVGTTFDCDTKVGPLRLTDRMTVTEWEPGRRMGIRHVGIVTGTGAFTLRAAAPERTEMVWTESLRFPWWMGGPVGTWVGAAVLRPIWRHNLRTFKRRVEGRPA